MAPSPPSRRRGFQFRAEELDDLMDLVESFLLIRGNHNLGEGVILQCLDDHAATKAQIHAEIGACHSENQLQRR